MAYLNNMNHQKTTGSVWYDLKKTVFGFSLKTGPAMHLMTMNDL